MPDYKIARNSDLNKLEQEVNNHLAQGYSLTGSLVAVIIFQGLNSKQNTIQYLQALIKT